MWGWLVRDWQWPAASVFAAVFLFALAPAIGWMMGTALLLVFLQLPIYMLHQWEEHAGDRFRLYINQRIGNGREILTPAATFWINSVGVWGVDLLAFTLAVVVEPSAGLVAGYLAVVNAFGHIAQALALREYNPGVMTAIVLFLPVGGACIAWVGADAEWGMHAIGLGAAIGVHVLIILHVARRRARLPPPTNP